MIVSPLRTQHPRSESHTIRQVKITGTDLNDGVTTQDAAALVRIPHYEYRSQELTDLDDDDTTQDTTALVQSPTL